MVLTGKGYANWTVVLRDALGRFALGFHHWLSALLTTAGLDVGFFVFIELGVSISYLRISVFFSIWFYFIVHIYQL